MNSTVPSTVSPRADQDHGLQSPSPVFSRRNAGPTRIKNGRVIRSQEGTLGKHNHGRANFDRQPESENTIRAPERSGQGNQGHRRYPAAPGCRRVRRDHLQ